jgi:RNA polymerase sigma-70 factor (ECF subfamily)
MENGVIMELYKNQMSIIYKYLIKLGCSKHEADDIVQEAFVRAIQYMDGVKPEKLPSWLFTVAINIFRTNRRRSKRIYLSIDEEQFRNKFSG